MDAREARAAVTSRGNESYSSSRDYPRDAAPRYTSREASPASARYASFPGRDREKEARAASEIGEFG